MSAFLPSKVLDTLPDPLEPNALYAVRTGVGFDLYVVDSTGSVAHPLNLPTAMDQVVILADAKAYNVDGGSITAGGFRTRELNSILQGGDFVSLDASGSFVLDEGEWGISWYSSTYQTNLNVSQIYNVTTASVIGVGSMEFAYAAGVTQNKSAGSALYDSNGTDEIELQHRVQTGKSTNGWGNAHDFSGTDNILAQVVAHRIS